MKQIIAIIWRAGSWKDLAWDFLCQKLQIPCYQISEALKISAKERWMKTSRENLIKIWKEFAEKYWDDYLAKVIIQNTDAQNIIITWMRQIWQLQYCKNNHRATFIWIESVAEIRFERLVANGKFSWSYDEFLALEKLDESKIQNVWKCLEYCDAMVENNWTIQEFETKLFKVLEIFK